MLYSVFSLLSCFLSFSFFSFWLFHFRTKSPWKTIQRDRIETVAQYVEWSQFVIDYFFGNLTYFTGILDHQTFRATANAKSMILLSFITPLGSNL